MLTQPWLSVLIPTYNGEDYIALALNSILLQKDDSIECIVVDDGSTDATLSILHEYQERLPMKIFQRERLGNWVENTNEALSYARGEYVCFLHQDDLWLQNRVQLMKPLILQFPNIGFFLHSTQYLDNNGNHLGYWRCPLPAYPKITTSNLMVEKLLVQNFIAIPAPILKRSLAQQVGGLDKDYWYTADWDFWLKIAGCSDAIYDPRPLSGFRIHPNSQTILRSSQAKDFRKQLEQVAKKHFAVWEAPAKRKEKVHKVMDFSMEVNIALASTVHGQKSNLIRLFASFLLLGPAGWHRYIRDSRICERISSRLKARLSSFKK